MTAELEDLVELLRKAHRTLIFTGAGISTGSGIPDFRGPNGVWTRRRPVYYQDFMTSEAARIEHWDYKLEAWPAFRAARPNPVHHAIVELENAGKVEAVVTQNIDGLHALAGSDPRHLIELHVTNM
jgi:NAD-dependent deacetylase